MYVEISDSDLLQTANEEEATHVKIVDKLRNVPVTVGGYYELLMKRYDDCAAVDEETYIEDDNGAENHSFWICCKKEFYKLSNTQK
ncbi:hypothetical protein [Paenibacillus xylanexedens]|uniref:hypothetical protein n=1 Tax=Paenibacillus xylanexedens TaxID=528191 RepID=UPI000F529EFB|nr:hypothetical protein [Paenibacillus xylanexedens]RPK31766.1 hypothetical protein EDO6_02393 [Paenibacillus xylanexedens]